MKKVLIIAKLVHASPRIPGFATYLPEFGWEATIISPSLDTNAQFRLGFPKQFLARARLVEAPYRGDIFWFWEKVFKIFGLRINESITAQIKERVGIISERSFINVLADCYRTIFAYPDAEKTWRGPALKVASEILKEEHFSAILSSSPFATSHIVAAELKSRFSTPWIADFRDLWTQNHNYFYGSIRKHFEEKLELKILASADAMTAVSPGLAKKQEHFHKRPTIVITNGFDPENLNDPPISLTEKFTITYTGSIYTGKQDPEKFLAALKNLISKKIISAGDVEVRFYGPPQDWLTNKITEYGLGAFARQYGVILRDEALREQRKSHILLILNWEDPEEKGVYTGKLFDYLSSQRPILAVGGFPESDLEKLLMETKAGAYAPTVGEIETALLNYYEEYKCRGRVSYNGDLQEISKYSYREIAKKFAILLDEITK